MAPMAGWALRGGSDEELYTTLCNTILNRVPAFRVRYKNKSVWQKFIAAVLFFIRGNRYLKDYTTTLGFTVWFPSEAWVQENYWRAFKVLAHEYVHLLDRKRYPRMFDLMYAFPLPIALLSLATFGVFFSQWFWLALVPLVALLPWPAFPRANLEMRAYTMGIAINFWRYGSVSQDTRSWLAKIFTGSDYYWMWPFKKDVERWIENAIRLTMAIDMIRAKDTVFSMSEAFEDVYEILTGIEHSREGME